LRSAPRSSSLIVPLYQLDEIQGRGHGERDAPPAESDRGHRRLDQSCASRDELFQRLVELQGFEPLMVDFAATAQHAVDWRIRPGGRKKLEPRPKACDEQSVDLLYRIGELVSFGFIAELRPALELARDVAAGKTKMVEAKISFVEHGTSMPGQALRQHLEFR